MKPSVTLLSLATAALVGFGTIAMTNDMHNNDCKRYNSWVAAQAADKTPIDMSMPNGYLKQKSFDRIYAPTSCTSTSSTDYFNALVGSIMAFFAAAVFFSVFAKITR
jgi:hypothetical protein